MKYILLLFFVTIAASAQSTINGKITNISKEVLAGASVIIKNADDKIVSHTITGNDGNYAIEAKLKYLIKHS
ncbi:carboxypeptidase regulatory-like domain-containing protein [Flavobacterium salilacus subsp. salilacus]|uniref:carboxypeptidase-like regulatory domain-containing protein n=1 Tax=Flavobacterium TaxID=237 RepID=UPI00107585BB|nr:MULTISPECIES: carboxypeptidase-like regulatory domain-containing protein [Flavobacterium]KAF2520199.1 carboxypeptidase regulatory-like domain-containing protein [Flavobacterium salilacus subsp. salilacus]MBE1613884.1 carboxypeptidase regulatory-like domain-containing protein [Flavobacterium sp. SaA2.13]